jgi:four helix bundle protein
MFLKNFLTYTWALEFYREVVKIKTNNILKDQLQRAALSVVLNLAEGAGRWSRKDQTRFYRMALGSFREVEACLDIINYKPEIERHRKLAASLVKLAIRS